MLCQYLRTKYYYYSLWINFKLQFENWIIIAFENNKMDESNSRKKIKLLFDENRVPTKHELFSFSKITIDKTYSYSYYQHVFFQRRQTYYICFREHNIQLHWFFFFYSQQMEYCEYVKKTVYEITHLSCVRDLRTHELDFFVRNVMVSSPVVETAIFTVQKALRRNGKSIVFILNSDRNKIN